MKNKLRLDNIKMIVMDMDGTLLNDKHELTQHTCEVLKRMQRRGISLVLASGRSIRSLQPLGKQLDMHLHKGCYICVNGAKTVKSDTMEEHIYQQLHSADIKTVLDFLLPYEVEAMSVQDAAIYDYIPQSLMEKKTEYRKKEHIQEDVPYTAGTFSLICDQRKNYDSITYWKDTADIQISSNKICIAHEPEVIAYVYEKLKAALGTRFNFVKTSPRWIECMPAGVGKEHALRDLMKEMQIDEDELLIFGDGENDLEMFSCTRHSIAMKNGMTRVKEAAEYCTAETNDEDGVACFLEQLEV